MTVQITGIKESEAFVKGLIGQIANATDEVLEAEGENIKSEAEGIVPVKSGRLRDSFNIDKSGNETIVGNSAPYAMKVHENIESVGSKYLEKPTEMAKGRIKRKVNNAIKEVIDGTQ